MKAKAIALFAVSGLAAGAQFYPPTVRDNPAVVEEIAAPREIRRILRRSCYDCHSFETRWPTYSFVAPASWLVVRDVREARRRMNFSSWPNGASTEVDCFFKRRIVERVDNAEMPPLRYRMLHPSAEVTGEEVVLLHSWARKACE